MDNSIRNIEVNSFRNTRGFTLFDLMIAVSVAGVILSVGVPNFVGFMNNNRAVSDTNDLVTSLNLGRSEAIRRGSTVTLCSSTDGATCSTNNDWSTGWIVRTSAGEVLRAWPQRSGGTGVLNGNVAQVQFQARGSLAPGVPPQLQLRLPHCSGDQARNIVVNSAGRIAVNRVACP
jgi:type IV fimbrial biogenesis protein FimT